MSVRTSPWLLIWSWTKCARDRKRSTAAKDKHAELSCRASLRFLLGFPRASIPISKWSEFNVIFPLGDPAQARPAPLEPAKVAELPKRYGQSVKVDKIKSGTLLFYWFAIAYFRFNSATQKIGVEPFDIRPKTIHHKPDGQGQTTSRISATCYFYGLNFRGGPVNFNSMTFDKLMNGVPKILHDIAL